MGIILLEEQELAYKELSKIMKVSMHRTPIFFYGKEGVGKSTIALRLKEEYKDAIKIIDISDLIRKFIDNNGKNKLLLSYTGESFLKELMEKHIENQILILDNLKYVLNEIKVSREFLIPEEYDFGTNENFTMNGILIWILEEKDFNSFKKYWEMKNSSLVSNPFIEVQTPKAESLKKFFEMYKKSEDLTISDKIIDTSLRNKYYRSLKIKKRRELVSI